MAYDTCQPSELKNAVAWVDEYFDSPDRKVLTKKELAIPGLQTFAHHKMRSAIAPLASHYHKNCMEITYISKGVITFSIQEKNYKLTGGDIFITFPDQIHSTNLTPLSAGEMFWFQLNIRDFEEILFLNEEASRQLMDGLEEVSDHLISIPSKEMGSFIKRAFQLCYTRENIPMAASYLALFLQLLLQRCHTPHTGLTQDIQQAAAYIASHVKEELSLDFLASQCGLSTSQFKQKFKSQMGIPPRNYINLQKIELAKEMLREGAPVTQIAMELGFNTSSYFSVVFKRYTTYSPSQYQKQSKNF